MKMIFFITFAPDMQINDKQSKMIIRIGKHSLSFTQQDATNK